MSDYSEVWEEMHEDQIKMEHKADKCKSVLMNNLSSDDMIRLMFAGYLKTLSNNYIIELHDMFIAKDDKLNDGIDNVEYIDTLKLKMEMIRHLLRFRFTWDEIYQVFGYSQETYNDAIKFLKDAGLVDFNTNN